ITKGFTYMYVKGEPLFPFGHGLSYTTFDYQDLALSTARMDSQSTETIRLQVTNSGRRAGDEVVQLYVRRLEGRAPRPTKELRGFQRITLDPGTKQTVT